MNCSIGIKFIISTFVLLVPIFLPAKNVLAQDCQNWVTIANIGGVIKYDPAVMAAGDRLVIVAAGSDNALWENEFIPATGQNDWFGLEGSIISGPSLAQGSDGKITASVMGSDNIVWNRTYQSSKNWTEWLKTNSTQLGALGPSQAILGNVPYRVIKGSNNTVEVDKCADVRICSPGAVSGCQVCKADGSGWADDNSKCAAGQTCTAGQCVNSSKATLADLWSGKAVLDAPELVNFNGRPSAYPLDDQGRVALVQSGDGKIYAYFRQLIPPANNAFEIYVAISTDGGKNFNVVPTPIISPQTVTGLGRLDTAYDPDVIKLADGYYMVFEGAGFGCGFSSFIAFSPDGLTNWRVKGVPVCSTSWGESASVPNFAQDANGDLYIQWANVDEANKISSHHQAKFDKTNLFKTITTDLKSGALPQSPAGAWDDLNFGSGGTIYENGYQYLFTEGANSFGCLPTWPPRKYVLWGIGMSRTSNLGVTSSWQKYAKNPLFFSGAEGTCFLQYPKIYNIGGDYYLYYNYPVTYWQPDHNTRTTFRRKVVLSSASACTDECSQTGARQCVGNGVRVCGNYDNDPCLEWSNVTNCGSDLTCSSGICGCTPNSIIGQCKVCNLAGTEWVNDSSACASGQVCSAAGQCVTPCGNWALVKNLGGSLKYDPSVSALADRLLITGVGQDSSVWSNEYVFATQNSGWKSIGGNLASRTRMTNNIGSLRINAMGTDGNVWEIMNGSAVWSNTGLKNLGFAGPDTVAANGTYYKVTKKADGSTDLATCSAQACTPNQVSGCRVCKSDGSGWADDNSKCATGQACENGSCAANPNAKIYFGAYTGGYDSGLVGNQINLDQFETDVGKRVSMLGFGIWWYNNFSWGDFNTSVKAWANKSYSRGTIPLISWGAYDPMRADGSIIKSTDSDYVNQVKKYSLKRIVAGDFDDYIKIWADQTRDWGRPVMMRLFHEGNGQATVLTGMPWDAVLLDENGAKINEPQDQINAWRHIINIFRREGANNASWLWSVDSWPSLNFGGTNSVSLASVYPGDDYVDWIGIEDYNFQTGNPAWWVGTPAIMDGIYNEVKALHSSRPLMIAEMGSPEKINDPQAKAVWIRQALSIGDPNSIPNRYPDIKAIFWWNDASQSNNGELAIESSPQSIAAFKDAIGNDVYATDSFANLAQAILPIGQACTPKTCTALGFNCGTASDGCSNTLSCGSCAAGQGCYGNKCAVCSPGSVLGCQVCNIQGTAWVDTDSKCASGQKCQNGVCFSCAAKTCVTLGNYECGQQSDSCGGTINCGTCASGKTCSAGKCVSNCASRASKKCDSGNLYWYNSCNTKEELAQNCGVDAPTDNYQCLGNWIQQQVAKKGCSDNACYSNSDWTNAADCSATGKICSNGNCVSSCTAKCSGKVCGSDNCGGSCGTCGSNQTCNNGICQTNGGGGGGGSSGVGGNINPPVQPIVAKPAAKMTRIEILAAIAKIQALIVDLQKQLAALTGSPSQNATANQSSTFSCTQIAKNLFYGTANDPQIKCLQEVLKSQGYAVAVSGNYDAATKTAVALFQQKYAGEILAPYHLTRGSGNVGNATRAKINQLMENTH